MEGSITRYTTRDELQDRLLNLEGHPPIILKPDLDSETILLRNTIHGRKQLQEYDNTIKTDAYRDNLKSINKCFIKHWPDLRILDEEVSTLSNRIKKKVIRNQ